MLDVEVDGRLYGDTPARVPLPAGEHRVSNFLLWESAYSEMVVTDTLWPDFDIEHLKAALLEYGSRVRRFGGRPDQELSLPVAGGAAR